MCKDKPLSFQIWVVTSIMNSLTVLVCLLVLLLVLRSCGMLRMEHWNSETAGALVQVFLCAVIFNIAAAKRIADTLIRPVRQVEQRMQKISRKEWEPALSSVDRQDEIGNLFNTLVNMQNSLIRMEEEEEFFLQSVSHGLKTPIMVIKNCCQALRDQIYINDSEEATIQVIEEEAAGLEDSVRKFLIINSFDYMLGKKSDFMEIRIQRMLRGIVDRFSAGNQQLSFTLSGSDFDVWGNAELLKTAITNIVENATRYANSFISISVEADDTDPQGYMLLYIKNDGEEIDDDILSRFFDKYHKGNKGNFGLGLYITKKIVEFHEGEVWVENDCGYVRFALRLKCASQAG